jgi:hypothetical protein
LAPYLTPTRGVTSAHTKQYIYIHILSKISIGDFQRWKRATEKSETLVVGKGMAEKFIISYFKSGGWRVCPLQGIITARRVTQ